MKTFTKIVIAILFLGFSIHSLHAQDGWSSQACPVTKTLNSVFFINSATGFISGNSGTLLRTDDGGQTWALLESITLEALNDIHFVDEECGYICGSSGKLLKTTDGGDTWSVISTGTYSTYYSVYFLTEAQGFAVGEFGIIAYTSDGGSSWSFQNNPANFGLYGVSNNGDYSWVTGDGGMILQSGDLGSTWTRLYVDVSNRLRAIMPRGEEVLIAGNNGIVLKTINSGQNWTAQYLSPSNLNDIAFPGDGNWGWIAGNSGNIWFTSDFGDSWSQQSTGTQRDLNGLYFIDASCGWAVGDYGTLLKYEGSSLPKTIYVDDDNTSGIEDGSMDHPYNTVAEGLNEAVAGDTVFIFCGDYPETPLEFLDVKPGLNLVGEDAGCTKIHVPLTNTVPYTEYITAVRGVDIPSGTFYIYGGGPISNKFYVGGSRVRHNLKYLTATKAYAPAKKAEGFEVILENSVLEGDVIVEVANDINIQIVGNTFSECGIRDYSGAAALADAHLIEDNHFTMNVPQGDTDTAIIAGSSVTKINNNTFDFSGGAIAIFIDNNGITTITDNTISNTDPMAAEQSVGIFAKSGEGSVSGNTITGGYYGYYSSSQVSLFENNTISQACHAVYSSGLERLVNNTITDCSGNGIIADGLQGPVQGNIIRDNEGTGIHIYSPLDLGGGSENCEGLNTIQNNGNYDMIVDYQPASAATFFAMNNMWDHGSQQEILSQDIMSQGGSNLTINIDGFICSPTTPVLQLPLNNCSDVGTQPLIRWMETAANDTYRLQLSEDEGFELCALDTNQLSDHEFIPTLQEETHYYWRVKTYNLAGESQWSETWEFSTGVAGVGDDLNYQLFDIWPNPASEIIYVSVRNLTGHMSASFEIIDLSGRMIMEKAIIFGSTATVINTGQLKDGMYCCRIVSKQGIRTSKIFIK